jgi:electron transport complex protein RnfC
VLHNIHRLWDFPGGVRLEGRKTQSLQQPLARVPVPARIVLPLQQHIGEPAEPVVEIGDRVLKGQLIARTSSYISAPVHASTSGTVIEIEEKPAPHPPDFSSLCVVIETDGCDQWVTQSAQPMRDYRDIDSALLIAHARVCGIVGMGGAAFPSAVKLDFPNKIDTLIINGAECEPYISCDEMLMRARPEAVIEGARIMRHALRADICVIGLEDNTRERSRHFVARWAVLKSMACVSRGYRTVIRSAVSDS